MSVSHPVIVLAVAVALGLPATAGAQDAGFRYLEAGIVGGFVNNVERAGSFTGNGALELESDAGGGGFVAGAWQFTDQLHLYGEYSSAGQELEVRGASTVSGEYDVVRWRIGLGYAHALSSTTRLYGRLSLDGTELKNLKVAGFNFDAEGNERGVGGEAGVIWAATPSVQLQAHARYTAVGELATSGDDLFDADLLVGLTGRWSFRPNIALFTGYEYGKITTLNLGVRFAF
jgi:hypothetical protein